MRPQRKVLSRYNRHHHPFLKTQNTMQLCMHIPLKEKRVALTQVTLKIHQKSYYYDYYF